MDPHFLHQCFAATLTADQETRHQAETQLRQCERSLGFLGACLDILSSSEVNNGVKTAAAVFFKNRIIRHWGDEETTEGHIDDGEKPLIRERLLGTLVSCPIKLRRQLVPVLDTIVRYDYPDHWPTLVDSALGLLYAGDLDSAYTGILCFAQVCSSFRWLTNETRPQLDKIINGHFATLLSVGDTLLKEESQEAGEMTVLLLKCYKYVTYHDLPVPLQSMGSISNWGNFHVGVINKQVPQYILQMDPSDRKLQSWVKAKKWAYANLYRLFQRYASHSLSKKFSYDEFRTIFSESFVPQLLNLYLTQIDKWCSKELWIGDEPLYHLISFIENAVTQKKTWPLLKPHFELLVSHFIFPLLCPSEDTLEKFENDPEDYIHTKLDIYEENNSPDLAAISLLVTLTTSKKKTTLEPVLQFAFNLLTQLKDPTTHSQEDAKRLEGALRLIGSLSDKFANEKSPYYSQMEQFLASLIFPHFGSKYSFIKARTCEVTSKFSDIEFRHDSIIGTLYRGILSCFEDENLPVQLEAALALQSFVKIPQFQEALATVVLPTMQKLLELSNIIDAEAISGVMQELVEVYSEQLQPFGVDLMTNLVEQFMRLARELNEAANNDVDDDGTFDDISDKQMAALGLLNTMITVLLSFEASAEIVLKLEETFYPVVDYVFRNNIEDFFREASELVENSTFLVRKISPTCWKLFEIIMTKLTSQDTYLVLYIDDLMPSINNYLVYGQDELKRNQQYSQALLTLYNQIMGAEDSSAEELGFGGEIAQKLILALGPSGEPYVEGILSVAINAVINQSETTSFFLVNMLDTIIAGIVHHAAITISTLGKGNFILPFFNLWFQYIGKLTRVYDLKLSTLGFLSLLNLNIDEIKTLQLETIVPKIGPQLAILMDKLPTAMQELERRRKEFEADEEPSSKYAVREDDEDDEDGWENEDLDEDADAAASDEYLKFLTEEAERLKNGGYYSNDDGGDDEISEDPLANDLLENINVFATFKEVVMNVQSTDPQRYQCFFGNMTEEENITLHSVLEL